MIIFFFIRFLFVNTRIGRFINTGWKFKRPIIKIGLIDNGSRFECLLNIIVQNQ